MSDEHVGKKRDLILDYEKALAQALASKVLDKPKPPLWMIFVPVFFVFFAQKMGQYKKGLQDFVDNYLKPRSLALEKAQEALTMGGVFDPQAPLPMLERIPESVRPVCLHWLTIMAEHYGLLLAARGNSHAALVRGSYRTKTDYLLFLNCLHQAENAFNLALLPGMEGDNQDLRAVVDRIDTWSVELRRQDADKIFP
jgi:hypothetical protein